MVAAVRIFAQPGSRQKSSIKKQVLALAVAALVAGCGGGSAPAPSPDAVIGALRAQAQVLAASSVTTEQAAVMLMDWAEGQYPELFPPHKTDQTDLPPFLYRFYPETPIYLGVVVQESGSAAFPLNGVFVKGGPFGDAPLFVGLISRFRPDIVIDNGGGGGGGGGGGNNGCYDLALFDTQGTTSTVTYQYLGPVTGTQTATSVVGAVTTFEGHSARETTATTTGSNTTQGITVAVNTQNKFYQSKTGDAEITQYGGISTAQSSVGGFNLTTTIKSVDSPPFVDRQYALAIGESQTSTVNSSVTTTITGLPFPNPPTTSQVSSTNTIKYVGRESVTVPAGTYQACKFESTTVGSAVVTTSWAVVGKGMTVKIVSGDQTIQATSATLNGAPL